MSDLYPLRFVPLFRRYLWGGRRLASVLNKPIGDGDDYAESWELVDHGKDQSVVAFGDLAGQTLSALVGDCGDELLGRHSPQTRFPLLFKFLDANRDLSVQVHPDDRAAAQLDPPDLGKTEAWVVIAAEPGSLIYAGLKDGVGRQELEAAMRAGTTDDCLHRFEPAVGDCIFIPAGTVHAIGAGLVVAEIQQASDTTFRLFDWNRVGPDGQPRPLHIEQGLDAVDYTFGPVHPQTPRTLGTSLAKRLVSCDKFVLDRWQISEPCRVGGDDRFHILALLDGEMMIEGDTSPAPLKRGQTVLLPASCGEVVCRSQGARFLDMYLPIN